MSEKENDKLNVTLNDVELDQMLTQWAKDEIEVPETFHNAVMSRLRTEQVAPSQKYKNKIISLSKRMVHKKAWASAIAAALIVCSIPILQNQQMYKTNAGNDGTEPAVQSRQSRMIERSDSEEQLMTTALFNETENAVYDTYGSHENESVLVKSSEPVSSESITSIEEQITSIEIELDQLETQLMKLKNTADNEAQRTALEERIAELREQIVQLNTQLDTESNSAEANRIEANGSIQEVDD